MQDQNSPTAAIRLHPEKLLRNPDTIGKNLNPERDDSTEVKGDSRRTIRGWRVSDSIKANLSRPD
jgi:hypothetical protein